MAATIHRVRVFALFCCYPCTHILAFTGTSPPIVLSPRSTARTTTPIKRTTPHFPFDPLILEPRSAANSLHSSSSPENGDTVKTRKKKTGPLRRFVLGFWNGLTLPFPALREVGKYRMKQLGGKSVGLSLREGILAIATYLAVGVLAYSVLFERWSVVDSLYFTCVCFSTVGYGDLCPSTAAGKLFTCLFGVTGISLLGAAIATISASVAQVEVDTVMLARKAARHRVLDVFENMPKTIKKFKRKPKAERKKVLQQSNRKKAPAVPTDETSLSAWFSFLMRLLPSITAVCLGGFIMKILNGGMNAVDTIYYSIITAATIGLGDLTPQTRAARVWAIFFIPLSVAATGELLSRIALAIVQRRQKRLYKDMVENEITMDYLSQMDVDQSGAVSREEYVQFMLLQMGLISQEELNELHAQFKRLDVTNSGYLDQEDLELMAQLRGKQLD